VTDNNMPILYQNVLFGLPTQVSREAFLWAVERPGEDQMCYRAEAFAYEVLVMEQALGTMLDAGAKARGKHRHDADLTAFILQRHANWRFGGNQNPPYARRVA
jgi:hypothetical protein